MTQNDLVTPPDHGGGVDAAADHYGGARANWLDLSTGINPVPYPLPDISPAAWAVLPDKAAQHSLTQAARQFWNVPPEVAVLAAPGASAVIAMMPLLAAPGQVRIAGPTYNEHGRAFLAAGWQMSDSAPDAEVHVHPNNPDGRLWNGQRSAAMTIIDESFCDVMPTGSLMPMAREPGVLILKSFGKFWGLAGLRLGFAIGDPALIARLASLIGPWPVSGPALQIGTTALQDQTWARMTRERLTHDAARLDALIPAPVVGGTSLFRLYEVGDAAHWQATLARHQIWSRIFPYSTRWLRLGLPGTPDDWARLTHALKEIA